MIRIALDTNYLAYLAGVDRGKGDKDKVTQARALLPKLKDKAQLVVPTQALGELFNVLIKAGAERAEARELVIQLRSTFDDADSASSTMVAALDLAVDHRLQIWDALIMSAAVEAGCTLLLSEDMQDGFVWRGLRVTNPFATPLHASLAALLE